MKTVPGTVFKACNAARAALIRKLARNQLSQPCRQALTPIA